MTSSLILVYKKLGNISKHQTISESYFQKLEFITLGANHWSFEGQNTPFCPLSDEGGASAHIFPVEVVTQIWSVVRVVTLELTLFSNMLIVF